MNNKLLFYLNKMDFHIEKMWTKQLPQEIAYHRRMAKYWSNKAANRYKLIN